ncbi:MAG TPA: TetR family transcriptional regulator, partial [Myxococcales bacterium]|nr:TetR family transcriptional regulator [Myxococcales bacterium]
MKRARRTNAEWSEATTGALVRRAREAFGEAGYAAASVEQIAEEAGLTKGAVYYHYRSKRGLFEAVFRDVSREIVTRIEERADAAPDPWEAVAAGCEAFLDVALDDE